MTMRTQRGASGAGFTLIELLVALFITAIIFAMGYGSINRALEDQDALKDRQDRLAALQTTMRVFEQDFVQLAPRPVRDQVGDGSLACLIAVPLGQTAYLGPSVSSSLNSTLGSSSSGSSSGAGSSSLSTPPSALSGTADNSAQTDLVIFTRTGWANPAGIQRPALERVSYRIDKGTLVRMHYPVLDITETTLPLKRDMIDKVKAVSFRFLTDARQWIDQWPPPGAADLRLRPFAVEITLDLEDWGRVVRIIEVPT